MNDEPTSPDTPTALVLVAEGSEEIEVVAPADVLVRCGVAVTLAGIAGITPKGSRWLPLRTDRLIGALRGQLFHAVVVPGGNRGAANIAASEAARLIIQHHSDTGRVVSAICAAPAVVLGPMGLLEGRRVTGYPTTRDAFPADATYVDERVVEDGQLITSQGPATAIEFGLAIGRRLTGEKTAARVAREMLV